MAFRLNRNVIRMSRERGKKTAIKYLKRSINLTKSGRERKKFTTEKLLKKSFSKAFLVLSFRAVQHVMRERNELKILSIATQ